MIKKSNSLFTLLIIFNISNAMDRHLCSQLYESVKEHCLHCPILVNDIIEFKSVEQDILAEFISICPSEPNIDFIQEIITAHQEQDYVKALRSSSKKGYWEVGAYLLDTRCLDTFSLYPDVVKRFIWEAAYCGIFHIVEKFLHFIEDQCSLREILDMTIRGDGNVDIVKLLVSKGVEVTMPDVIKSIEHGHFDLVKYFLEDYSRFFGFLKEEVLISPVLYCALFAKKNRARIVDFLINFCRVDVFQRTVDGYTPLEYLLLFGKRFDEDIVLAVKHILSVDGYFANEIDIDFIRSETPEDYYKEEILEIIGEKQKQYQGKAYTLSRLIWHDVDNQLSIFDVMRLCREQVEQNYRKAFLIAISQGKENFVTFFLSGEKLSPYIISDIGTMIKGIGFAIKKGHTAIAKQICKKLKFSDINAKDWERFIDIAASYGDVQILKVFLLKGAQMIPSIYDIALGAAVQSSKIGIINALISYRGFSVKALNKAALIAASKGDQEMVELLFSLGACNQEEVLIRAFENRKKNVLALFVDKVIDENYIFHKTMSRETFLNEEDIDILERFFKKGIFLQDSIVSEAQDALQRRNLENDKGIIFSDSPFLEKILHNIVAYSSVHSVLDGILKRVMSDVDEFTLQRSIVVDLRFPSMPLDSLDDHIASVDCSWKTPLDYWSDEEEELGEDSSSDDDLYL